MKANAADLDETRLMLREWAWYFRDRHRTSRTFSAEGNWRSPQVWQSPPPRPDYEPRRAMRTWDLLRSIDHPPAPIGKAPYYRALTWRYCYPTLAVGIPLRALGRRLGYKVNLRAFDDLVSIGEFRLAHALYIDRVSGYTPHSSGALPSVHPIGEAVASAT